MEAVEAVARDHPQVGVVMFTGFATVDSAVQSMKLGALDYLPKPFTPEELLEVTSVSLEKTWKARRDREIEQTYAEAEKALTSSLDLKEILNLICASVVRLVKVKAAALHMYRKKDDVLEIASSCGLSDEFLKKGVITSDKGIAEALEFGQPVLIDEAAFGSKLHHPEEAKKEGIKSILSVPLRLDEAILGFLRIYSAEKRSFSDEEMDLLIKFAEQASRAIENAMAYERVRGDIEGMKKSIPQPVARKMQEKG